MAVILDTKPRVRLASEINPEPAAARNRNWLPCYASLWLVAIILGHGLVYGWLPFTSRPQARPRTATSQSPPRPSKQALENREESQPSVRAVPSGDVMLPTQAADLATLPSCESVSTAPDDEGNADNALPVDLSRSAMGELLEVRQWTSRCRASKAYRVHLCLAVRNGAVVGATVHADPRNEGLERCIVRAAQLVPVEPEPFVHTLRLDTEIPPERRW